MCTFSEEALQRLAAVITNEFPLRHNPDEKKLSYGTAGFRTTGSLLIPVAARLASVVVLRSIYASDKYATGANGSCIGVVVTASHNAAIDNGLKVIDYNGGMLEMSWEPMCNEVANTKTGDDLVRVLKSFMTQKKSPDATAKAFPSGMVSLARDTRETGEEIAAAMGRIFDSVFHIAWRDLGRLTTPQLHFIVNDANSPHKHVASTVSDYYCSILSGLKHLLSICPASSLQRKKKIVIDLANGVGWYGMKGLLDFSKTWEGGDIFGETMDITLVNTNHADTTKLNLNCGAEFAKSRRTVSEAMQKYVDSCDSPEELEDTHFYCFDGDADRVVAFYYSTTPDCECDGEVSPWHLLDGDRMSILFSDLFHQILGEPVMEKLKVGVVQTAYANGASSAFVTDTLHMKLYFGATGVKNLHPIAHAQDIGIYFEANGHGTALFNLEACKKALAGTPDSEKVFNVIVSLSQVLSQVCGDSIGDMLASEIAIRFLNFTFEDWSHLYQELPSLQAKVSVPNPRVITTTPEETTALTPAGLQDAIDEAVAKTKSRCQIARSFVRPSGTEPIVRVYAEAADAENCKALAAEVEALVKRFCGN